MTVRESDRRSHKFALDTEYFSLPSVYTVCQSVIFITFCRINTITTAVTVRGPSPTNETLTANGSESHHPLTGAS